MNQIAPRSNLGYLSVIALADPEPISKMVLIVALSFVAAWGTVSHWLGIGDGRREADAIVPLQNTIGSRLAEIVNEYPTADLPTLQRLYDELHAMAAEFQRFVSDPRFEDGRASQQALASIMPLILDNIQKIWARITSLTSTPPPVPQYESLPDPVYSDWVYATDIPHPAGGGDSSMLMGGLFLMLLLSRKRKR